VNRLMSTTAVSAAVAASLLFGMLPASATPVAAPVGVIASPAELERLRVRMASPPSAEPETRTWSSSSAEGARDGRACFESAFNDDYDGSQLDVSSYGIGLGCGSDPSEWLFYAETFDNWVDSNLYTLSLYLDVDRNPATGCYGFDRVVFGMYSTLTADFSATIFDQPTCDSSTWSTNDDVFIGRTSTRDVAFLFSHGAIGSPASFDWTASMTGNSDTHRDVIPNVGAHTASGYAAGSECTAQAEYSGFFVVSEDARLPAALRAAGARDVRSAHGVTTFNGDQRAAEAAIRKLDTGARVHRDYYRSFSQVPNDSDYATQWNLAAVDAPGAWNSTRGSSNVVVAVVDSGVDATHPELANQLTPGYDAENSVPLGYGNHDLQGHGTSVAGVVSAVTDNGSGLAALGWNTRVMPIRIARADGSASASATVRGIRYAADNGARIINLSLGSCVYIQAEADAISHAQSKDVLVIASAGNDGPTAPPNYPAALPGVLAVGATGRDGVATFYSNTGSYVDVVAPGGTPGTSSDEIPVLARGGGFRTIVGTSFSAPTVAAAAALVAAANPGLPAADIAGVLTETASDRGPSGFDEIYGHGALNAAAAAERAVQTRPQPTPSPTVSSPPPAGPSPSPTAVAPPEPKPEAIPRLTLSTSAISAGESVHVYYTGEPDTIIEIFSRTQPATDFSRIGSVHLDQYGRGSSSHKPQKNTRITAKSAGGRMSDTAPIIAVRTVASFNARRVATNTYTFTGRVYPALNQRAVYLYRDGVFVGVGRCDASGIYSITRTLGGGTYTFEVRTRDDMHNLGTNSRKLRFLVY
jgi:subtilisin family serine protease